MIVLYNLIFSGGVGAVSLLSDVGNLAGRFTDAYCSNICRVSYVLIGKVDFTVSEKVSRFLTARQNVLGYLVPYCGVEGDIKE